MIYTDRSFSVVPQEIIGDPMKMEMWIYVEEKKEEPDPDLQLAFDFEHRPTEKDHDWTQSSLQTDPLNHGLPVEVFDPKRNVITSTANGEIAELTASRKDVKVRGFLLMKDQLPQGGA